MKNIKLKKILSESYDDYKSPESDFKTIVGKLVYMGYTRKDFYELINSIVKK